MKKIIKKISIIISVFFFSFAQAKEICISNDDLMDYAIVSYMETTWATMDACMEKIPNYDYRIYEKFIVEYKKLLDTSDKYNDAWFKENYGNEWQQKKKANLALIRSDSSANSVSIIKLKEMCDELNSNSEKYINEGKETFLDDIGIMARAVRSDLPKCAEKKKKVEKTEDKNKKKEAKKIIKEAMENLKIKLICEAFGDGYVFDKNGKLISYYTNDGDKKESIEILAVEDDDSFEVTGVLVFMDFMFKITTMNEKTIRAKHIDYGHAVKIDRITGVMESRLIGQTDGTQFTDDWNCKKAEKQF